MIRPKTVDEVLGEAFDYLSTLSANSFFCKKLLKYCSKDFSSENLIFLLMQEKSKKTPSEALLNAMYHDFIPLNSKWEINIPSTKRNTIIAEHSTGSIFALTLALREINVDAIANIDFNKLRAENFDTAFLLQTAPQKEQFDKAIAYLNSYRIALK